MASAGTADLGHAWRGVVRRVSAVMLGLTMITGGYLGHRFWAQEHPPVRMAGIQLGADGQVREASIAYRSPPLMAVSGRVDQQQEWLGAGRIPTVPELGSTTLVSDALVDLDTLARPYGVAVAGWAPAWRYVWPRDAAFVASALARTGHPGDAERNLAFLQRVQPESGLFEARYLPDGSGVPDGRGHQQDGTGWSLWALQQVASQVADGDERTELIDRYRRLLDRSSEASLRLAATRSGLPPASADYWEVKESRLTLSTAAILLTGLRSSADLHRQIARPAKAAELDAAADRVQQAMLAAFGPDGFPRRHGGSARSADLGTSFLLAPFAGVSDASIDKAWAGAPIRMRRPAGGLAPGGSWRNDGISWTPTTSTYAVAAACRDRASALHWLGWLDQHRTDQGALPEKVLRNGSPASVAPLAWTAAAVVIAVDELERGC
jgi:glucoamylase